MPTKVAFVVAIGRLSNGNMTALPKVQGIVAQHGGTVTGGVGSSQDPIMAEFADAGQAAKAAQQAWYLDDIEFAKVINADMPGAVEPIANPPENKSQDQGPSQYPKNFGIKEAVAAVAEGKSVTEVADALLAEKVEEAKVEEITEAKNRWGHDLKKGMKVKVAHPRGGVEEDEVEKFEADKDYGKRVHLKSGKTCGVDDCIPA